MDKMTSNATSNATNLGDALLIAIVPAVIALVGVIIVTIVGYRQTIKQIQQSNECMLIAILFACNP